MFKRMWWSWHASDRQVDAFGSCGLPCRFFSGFSHPPSGVTIVFACSYDAFPNPLISPYGLFLPYHPRMIINRHFLRCRPDATACGRKRRVFLPSQILPLERSFRARSIPSPSPWSTSSLVHLPNPLERAKKHEGRCTCGCSSLPLFNRCGGGWIHTFAPHLRLGFVLRLLLSFL